MDFCFYKDFISARRNKDEEKGRESIELGPVGAFDPDRSAGGRSDACCVRRLVGSRPGAA